MQHLPHKTGHLACVCPALAWCWLGRKLWALQFSCGPVFEAQGDLNVVPRRGLDPKIQPILYEGFKAIANRNYP